MDGNSFFAKRKTELEILLVIKYKNNNFLLYVHRYRIASAFAVKKSDIKRDVVEVMRWYTAYTVCTFF